MSLVDKLQHWWRTRGDPPPPRYDPLLDHTDRKLAAQWPALERLEAEARLRAWARLHDRRGPPDGS